MKTFKEFIKQIQKIEKTVTDSKTLKKIDKAIQQSTLVKGINDAIDAVDDNLKKRRHV